MLKITKLSDKPAPNRNNGNKSAFSGNNNRRPVSMKIDGNSKVNRFNVSKNDVKYAKKLEQLSKSRKSKSKKMSKSQNLAKSEIKLSKS